MAQVIWSPDALADLESLLNYIAEDAPLTAERFAAKVVQRVDQLILHPLSGGYISEDATKTYRELFQGNYRIIYRVDGQTVFIVAVRHASRLLDGDDLN
jgi:toxin ParE1/3/4